jgi:hypothetical protein
MALFPDGYSSGLISSGAISLGRSASSTYGSSIALELGLAEGATISLNDIDTRRVAKLPSSESTISMPTNFFEKTVLGFNNTNDLNLRVDSTAFNTYSEIGILFFQAITYEPYGPPGPYYVQRYVGDIFYDSGTYGRSLGVVPVMSPADYPTSWSVRNGVQPYTNYKVDFTGYGLNSGPNYSAYFNVDAYDESTFQYRSSYLFNTSGTYSTGWNILKYSDRPQSTRLQMYLYVENYSNVGSIQPYVVGTVSFRNGVNIYETISRNFSITVAVRGTGY